MKYLQKSFTLPAYSPKKETVQRPGRKTYRWCAPCQKVHEVMAACEPKAKSK
jgi:hypothetical protein